LLFLASWGAVVGVCAKVDVSHSADYWVRENGAWLHETISRRPDCATQSG